MNQWKNPSNFMAFFRRYDDYRPATSQMPKMSDIGSRKLFNSDHDMFRESVRKFFDQEVKPYHGQ